jgi:lysophospholipase L1-like esterase
MKSPRKWSAVGTAVLLAVAVPALVVSGSSSAQEDGVDHANQREWVGTWDKALTPSDTVGRSFTGFNNESFRSLQHVSIGGDKVRIRFANPFGTQSVTIGKATVAKPDTTTPALNDIDASTLRNLTFNGHASATMLKGQELLSDPVDMRVADGGDLVTTMFFPTATGPTSWHATARQTAFIGAGDLSADAAGTGFTVSSPRFYFVTGVDVLRSKAAGSVVVLADSIADGNGSTLDANTRWPDFLAKRLVDLRRNGKVPGVLNAALAGNRLNHEGTEPGADGFPGFPQLGANANARLNIDVFAQTGVHTVLFDLGINDIWMTGDSADAIIDAIRVNAKLVREHGLRFVVGTLGPYEGFDLDGVLNEPDDAWTPAKEATRNAVNEFIRSHRGEFDGVVDFDQVLRDPAAPSKVKAEFDSGDHIHPNDAGAQAMANIIPLNFVLN